MIYSLTRRAALIGGACAAMLAMSSAPSQAAAKIQRLVSPGGIEAWFVQDATVPLIAMEYSFSGGASQDPPGKPGVGNLVADLLDEAERSPPEGVSPVLLERIADRLEAVAAALEEDAGEA